MSPKISVIVPVFGVEKYLSECLDSILCQTFKDFELLLIDDGSVDNCSKIIDAYAEKDNRIIPIHKENEGYGKTCNLGLNRAQGDYISIIEPDDFIEKTMFENLYKIAEKFNSDIVKSQFFDNLQSLKKTRIKKVEFKGEIPTDRSFVLEECPLFLKFHPSIWSCLYKRDFLNSNNIRFKEAKGSAWTDNTFQVETLLFAKRINFTKKAFYYWRRLDDNGAKVLSSPFIPIERMNEIYDFLQKNNVTNPEILSCLAVRAINYIDMIVDKAPLWQKENKHLKDEVQAILEKIDVEAFKNSKFAEKKKFIRFLQMKSSIVLYAIKRKIARMIRF